MPFQRWLEGMAWPLAIFIMVMLGLKMLLLSRKAKPPEKAFDLSNLRILTGVAFASGINAFIIGMTTGLISTDLYPAILILAMASFAFSIIGVILGKVSGNTIFGQVSEALGGFLIIFTGVMLLLEFIKLI
jgi:putative Mn2+ efflux pump MntP